MADYSYLQLIEGLNSDSPVVSSSSSSSPDDFADLALWTNAEFTFDLGDSTSSASSAFLDSSALLDSQPQQLQQQEDISTNNMMDYMNLSTTPQQLQQQARPMSLLERTRQGNPVAGQVQFKPVLQEQIVAANAYQSLMASYSNSLPSFATTTSNTTTAALPQFVSSSTLLYNAPLTAAPTTPAAAKLLRQTLPQYKSSAPVAEPLLSSFTADMNNAQSVDSVSRNETVVPRNQNHIDTVEGNITNDTTAILENNNFNSHDDQESDIHHELSAADSFSKDDPAYSSKVAVEEDKRRRNTAASARFRQKKRLREQTLEQSARDQTVRAEQLEKRVRELEMEVRWLRGLIVDKDSRLHEATLSLQDHQTRISLFNATSINNDVEESNKRIRLDAF